jgi:DNA-binding HxlR family transcriptional regulator
MATKDAPRRKCYRQTCSVARALDIVGDRWTLLILRELLGGPARFHELLAGLPGIAKNLLTERLRRLEEDEIIRRVTSPSSTLYALTEQGMQIRPTVESLGLWGARVRKVEPPKHDRSTRSVAVALHAFLIRAGSALPTQPVVVELVIEGDPLEIVVGPDPTVTARTSVDPDARVSVSRTVMAEYLAGREFDKKAFGHLAGERSARSALLKAMGAMF